MMADTFFSDRERHAEAAVPDLAPKGDWTEMPDLAEYATTQEAAEILGFTVQSIRNMVYNGKLECLKVGRSVMISRKSLQDYVERTQGMNKNDPRRHKGETDNE